MVLKPETIRKIEKYEALSYERVFNSLFADLIASPGSSAFSKFTNNRTLTA